jgi:hypothetical protein
MKANACLSENGDAWSRMSPSGEDGFVDISLLTAFLDFSHDHARSRAYRWGEDGIAGVCDTHGQLNIGFSFWNEKELVRRVDY